MVVLPSLPCFNPYGLPSLPGATTSHWSKIDGPGAVTIRVLNNRMTGINSGNYFRGFGEHGNTGPCTIQVENNHFGPVDGDGLDFDFLPGINQDISLVLDFPILTTPSITATVQGSQTPEVKRPPFNTDDPMVENEDFTIEVMTCR